MKRTNFDRKAKNSVKIKKMIDAWIKDKGFLVQGVTIEDLGRFLGINRTYVSNYINDTYKTNFNGWINSMRIEEAKKLIRNNPSTNLGQVAGLLGYSDITHFSKQFKSITGINPSIWKKDCTK